MWCKRKAKSGSSSYHFCKPFCWILRHYRLRNCILSIQFLFISSMTIYIFPVNCQWRFFWGGTVFGLRWTGKKRHRFRDTVLKTRRKWDGSQWGIVTRFQVVHPFVSMPPVVRLIPFCYRFFRASGSLYVDILSILQCVYRFVREMFCLIRLLSFYS